MSALTDATNTMPTEEAVGNETKKSIAEEVVAVQELKVGATEIVDAAVVIEEHQETEDQKKIRLNELIVTGRRFLKLDDFYKAVDTLSDAASLSLELFGEDEFEVTFLYGQALLGQAKMEDDVLNNALSDIPKEKDCEEEEEGEDGNVENPDMVPKEEREEIKQQVEEALGVQEDREVEAEAAERAASDAEDDSKPVEEVSEAVEQEKASKDVEEGFDALKGSEVTEEKTGEFVERDAEEEEEEEEEEEDYNDPMKLAWEVLETARWICECKIKKCSEDTESLITWKLKLADVLSFLGEHGSVDNKYEQAQNDLLAAVALQATHLEPTSRLLANTHHLLGKAFMMSNEFAKAAEHYSDSKNILIAKVEDLKKREGEDEEIKELEELIPEIDAQVLDALSSEEQHQKVLNETKKEMKSVKAVLATFEGEETKDISGLVRRKRPVEETNEDVDDGEEAKKPKTEGVTEEAANQL